MRIDDAKSDAPVGVVTTSYPRGRDDFAGSFVRTRVRALVAGGARVEVIAAGSPALGFDPSDEPSVAVTRVPFAVDGCAPLFYGAGAPETLERLSVGAFAQAARFWGGLTLGVRARTARWCAVESHWLVPCGLAVATLAPPRHRAHAHSGDIALLERLVVGRSFARLLARSLRGPGCQLIFASAALHDRFVRLLDGPSVQGLRCEVHAAPFDTGTFTARTSASRADARAALSLRPSDLVIAGVGRLVPIKGFDRLVLAVARLPAQRRPMVIIVGDGPERDRLRGLARRTGVDLRLPGLMAAAGVARHLHAADLYVQPSLVMAGRTEGDPVAAREALAVGLPALVGRSGALPELPGVTAVDATDLGAFAAALMRHLNL